MTRDSEMVARLFDEQPMRVSGAAASPSVGPPTGHRHVLAFSPPMAETFWGSVTFSYQAGKLVNAAVSETMKP